MMANTPLNEKMYEVEDRGFETMCWVWLRATTKNGYGIIRRDRRNQPAHVWFYEQKYGPVPDGKQLDHLCRVRACANPDHVEPVTHAENGRRGRATILDWPRVHEIRRLAATGARHASIAATFGVAPRTISGIVAGDRWKEDGGS